MTDSVREIAFDYANRQGRYRVIYLMSGIAMLYAYSEVPMDDRDGQPATPAFIQVHLNRWLHAFDFSRWLRCESTDAEALEQCRSLFSDQEIGYTFLERPDGDQIPCLSFDVTMCNGLSLKAMLRADGMGWLLQTCSGPVWTGKKYLTGSAQVPSNSFHHTIERERIVQAADLFERYEELGCQIELSTLSRTWEETFWTEVNGTCPNLHYLRRKEDLSGVPLSLAHGTAEELQDLIADACRLDEEVWEYYHNPEFLVHSAADGRDWSIDPNEGQNEFFQSRTLDLVTALLHWFAPRGYWLGPNGASEIKWSGYDRIPHLIGGHVALPTATERIEALDRLIAWSEQTGVVIEPYLPE